MLPKKPFRDHLTGRVLSWMTVAGLAPPSGDTNTKTEQRTAQRSERQNKGRQMV